MGEGVPEISTLQITSITNLLLAAEALFFAFRMARRVRAPYSAAWFWAGTLLFMGLASVAGAIDHGLFEPAGLPRYPIQRFTWLLLAATTFCLIQTAVRQFFAPRLYRVMAWAGLLYFAAGAAAALLVDDYRVVIVTYTPAMLLLLTLNVAGLSKGTGSVPMIAGLVTLAAASLVQAAHIDVFSPLDHNGLYHVISIVGVALLYRGGIRLN